MPAPESCPVAEPPHSSCGEEGRRRTSFVYLVTVNYKFMTLWCNCCIPCSIHFLGRACWAYKAGVFYGCSVCLSCVDKSCREVPCRTRQRHSSLVLARFEFFCQRRTEFWFHSCAFRSKESWRREQVSIMCKENEIGFKEALAFDICFTQRFSNTALFFFFFPHTLQHMMPILWIT